jgi:Predicted membrane protein
LSTIFLRAFVLYALMLLTIRGMGKHQLGQYQPYELALAMLIANLASTPMSNVSTPLLHGALPIAALFVTHGVITLLCMRSDSFRAFISGRPSVVVTAGVIDRAELSRLCISLSDLLEGVRTCGILNPDDLGTAIIEADGSVSAFPNEKSRTPTTEELSIPTTYEGLSLMLIMDGNIQVKNLEISRQDERWLTTLLAHYNLKPQDVLLASLDTSGTLRVQDSSDALLHMQALSPEEVCW